MCGIVGYTGPKQAAPILVGGLYTLEYRGYDSAGIALQEGGALKVIKTKGRIKNLEDKIGDQSALKSTCGIGHTRWATHGEPSDANAHPHFSKNGRFAVVHNGIIENYMQIKDMLRQKGYEFASETDTEAAAHLFELNYKGDALQALVDTCAQLRGSYALGVICLDEPGTLVCTRRDNPLVIGVGEGENVIASDIPAIMGITKNYIVAEDGEFFKVTSGGIICRLADGTPVTKKVQTVTWDFESAQKGGYDHFMIKEIMEQPAAVRKTIGSRIENGLPNLYAEGLPKGFLRDVRNIHMVGCGSAYYAGLAGKVAIERLAGIPVLPNVASEFRYCDPIIGKDDLFIAISQSGETADTLASLREAKKRGAKTLAVVNVLASSAAREADCVLYTWAGPEIAVATTKAYSTQMAVMYLLAMTAALERGRLSEAEVMQYCESLTELPGHIEAMLKLDGQMKELAELYYKNDYAFFIGRGIDHVTAQEGSLKLKEIAYVHSEAYAGGELKHGPISLIEDNTLVIALATDKALYEKQVSNIQSVKARGAKVIIIANESLEVDSAICDHVVKVPDVPFFMAGSPAIVPVQFFAYHIGVCRDCDIDKPRNLAKSVTVE